MTDNTEQLAADVEKLLKVDAYRPTVPRKFSFDIAQGQIRQLVRIIQEQGEDIKGLRNSGDKVVEYWAEQSLAKTKAIRELEV